MRISNCPHCGVELTEEAEQYTTPTTKSCGCVCFHFYQNLCPEHIARRMNKKSPLDADSNSTVIGINERYNE